MLSWRGAQAATHLRAVPSLLLSAYTKIQFVLQNTVCLLDSLHMMR